MLRAGHMILGQRYKMKIISCGKCSYKLMFMPPSRYIFLFLGKYAVLGLGQVSKRVTETQ